MLALALLVAVSPAATAQEPGSPAPPQLTPPGTLQDDADDEELGEEIPEDEQDDRDTEDPGGGSGGGEADPPAAQRATPAEPRAQSLPRTGGDPFPLLSAGLFALGFGLLLWAALPPAVRRA